MLYIMRLPVIDFDRLVQSLLSLIKVTIKGKYRMALENYALGPDDSNKGQSVYDLEKGDKPPIFYALNVVYMEKYFDGSKMTWSEVR